MYFGYRDITLKAIPEVEIVSFIFVSPVPTPKPCIHRCQFLSQVRTTEYHMKGDELRSSPHTINEKLTQMDHRQI